MWCFSLNITEKSREINRTWFVLSFAAVSSKLHVVNKCKCINKNIQSIWPPEIRTHIVLVIQAGNVDQKKCDFLFATTDNLVAESPKTLGHYTNINNYVKTNPEWFFQSNRPILFSFIQNKNMWIHLWIESHLNGHLLYVWSFLREGHRRAPNNTNKFYFARPKNGYQLGFFAQLTSCVITNHPLGRDCCFCCCRRCHCCCGQVYM